MAKLAQWVPGPRVTTASTATLAALRKVGAGRIALATPYVPASPTAKPRLYAPSGASTAMAAGLIQPSGGSQPHTNMAPYLGINFIISLFGVFPSQN